MAVRLISHQEWTKAQSASTDQVSVQRLKLSANTGHDIWGRRKSQPIEISATLNLRDPFTSAATSDSIDISTVHYGELSKRLLAVVNSKSPDVWTPPDGLIYEVAFVAKTAATDPSIIASTEIELSFPKASRFGEGVTLSLHQNLNPEVTSSVLHMKCLHLPALIGINDHETKLRQRVIVSVWIDRARGHISESYVELEQLIEKTVEESSFGTLEALAEELAGRVVKYFILPKQDAAPQLSGPEPAGVRIRVAKPSAVTAADTPCIEIYRSAEPQEAFGRRMAAELGTKRIQIPWPLNDRLDEFLQQHKQD